MDEEREPVAEAKVAPGGASARAITALVLGIVGLGFCPPTAIVALITGKLELSAIARGKSSPQGRGLALTGYILGIVGAVFMVFWIVYVIVIICLGLGACFLENVGL